MKNYDAWMTEVFQTSLEEVDATPNRVTNKAFYLQNLTTVQRKYGTDIVWFTLKHVPIKRSDYDHACLLIFQREDGTFWAKRHNNSQHFYLEY